MQIIATRCLYWDPNLPKLFCGRGSAPDPAVEAYSAPPDPLAAYMKGAASGQRKEGMNKN